MKTRSNKKNTNADLMRKMDAYWRAANYLSVGQIYLYDNPLLKKPLKLAHIKPRLLGHWGTTPGLNFIYAHLNRVIKEQDLNMIYRHLPLAPGADGRHESSGAREDSGKVDEELSPAGVVRHSRQIAPRTCRASPERRTPHERQSSCQRRSPAPC